MSPVSCGRSPLEFDGPIRALGFVDASRLTDRVLATPESAWHCDNRRQSDYEVHAQTQSIVLVFFSGWPEVNVAHASGWDDFHDVAMPVIDTVVATHYSPGGMVLRAVLARVLPACRIDLHVDHHPSFSVAHRVHVPLVTSADVHFMVGTERVDTRVNRAFELNNKMAHSVENRGSAARIHLIFDYAPA